MKIVTPEAAFIQQLALLFVQTVSSDLQAARSSPLFQPVSSRGPRVSFKYLAVNMMLLLAI